MFIDIHAHLEMCHNLDEVVKRAKERNVLILTSGVNVKINEFVIECAKKWDNVRASPGLYPMDGLIMNDSQIEDAIDYLRRNKDKITAIGEVGMDFKESSDTKEWTRQAVVFRKMIRLAMELDKPVVVHSRKAEEDCIKILEEEGAKKVVMHCFNGNFKLIKRVVDNRWFMTVPTNVIHSEHFQKVIREVSLNHLFCETDSPYLHPFKERNNEPSNVIESYKKIAEIKGLGLIEVEAAIETNFKKLFG
jgi:TatD DNase family protein